jgi:hypothetical protein
MGKNDYALVIGINDYPNFTSLNSACKDAQNMHAWLTNESGGGLPDFQCKLLLSGLNPTKPLYMHIDEEMQILYDLAKSNKESRRFYFYFSGHGIGESPDDNALCMADWSRTFRIRALSSRDYINNIVNSGYFTEVFFLLDCCRNNLVGGQGLPPSNPFIGIGKKTSQCRKFIAYATDYTNPAFEAAVNKENTLLNNSFFTKALLEGLNGAAADPDTGIITAQRLKQHTTTKTSEYASIEKKLQRVEILDGLDENTVITQIVPQKTKLNISFKFSRFGNDIALIDSKLNKITTQANDEVWQIELAKNGLYLLSDETNGEEIPLKIQINQDHYDIEF